MKRLFRSILPPASKPPTWVNALPLVFFLAVFAAVCAALHLSGKIVFTHLWPFGLLVFAPWLWWIWLVGRNGLPRLRSLTALLLRLAIFGLFIFTLAEPRTVRFDDRLSVVFAIDVSGSVTSEAADHARRFVSQVVLEGRPVRDSAALVYFGKNAGVQLPPRTTATADELQSVDVRVGDDGSNLARALSLSAAILPESQNGRIVLISDGVQTEGNLAAVLDELKSRDIAVDVLPVEYRYEDEILVERLDLPRRVEEGQTYEAVIVVSSLKESRGKIALWENGRKLFEASVKLKAGKNRFVVPIQLREPGYYEYAARIEPLEGDTLLQNNVAVGDVLLEGQGRTLVVTNPDRDAREWRSLVEALEQVDFSVGQMTPYDVPENPAALKAYDCILFVNVPRDAFTPLQIQAVHDAVYDEGLGFLMVGGDSSFGPGGWGKTPVEQALPVEMDITERKVLLNGALVLVLDHSGSMNDAVPGTGANKLQIAKHAAVEAMSTLGARDWLGVVSFDSAPTWVVPFSRNTNPEQAAQSILGVGSGGGTNMYPALDDALDALVALPDGEAAVRHVILLTDGRSHGKAAPFVERCQAAHISVSTIGVGDQNDVDAPLLAMIAQKSGGRFHHVDDATILPRILIREVVTIRRTSILNETFTPTAFAQSSVLKGIDALPPLHGMVLTVPKSRAELVLAAPPQPDTDTHDPVLAMHRYGTGRTAAFTSDLSPNWGTDWVSWQQYQAFVRQLITELSRTTGDSPLRIDSYAVGNEGVVQVEDHAPETSLRDLRAVVRAPDGTTQNIELAQTGPRRYQARFPLEGEGRYAVAVTGSNDRVSDSFVLPYSQEYLRFTANPLILKQIAEATGGRILTGDERGDEVYVADREPRQSSRSIVDLLLPLLALLIPLDVGVRRIQIDSLALRRWFSGEQAETSQVMSELLRQKQAVSKTLQGNPLEPSTLQATAQANRETPSPNSAAVARPRDPQDIQGSGTASRPQLPAKPADDFTTTAQRLLDAKSRKWQEP